MNGWNVIDTASNYRWGRAETSIGAALASLLAGTVTGDFLQESEYSQDITRSMLFISTKAGFTDESLVRKLVQARKLGPSDVSGGHTLDPEYIIASVEASLERLNLKTVRILGMYGLCRARPILQIPSKLKSARVAPAPLTPLPPSPSDNTSFLSHSLSLSLSLTHTHTTSCCLSAWLGGDYTNYHLACLLFSTAAVQYQYWVSRLIATNPQVDLLYLHNPAEMQLKRLGWPAFRDKLKKAFIALESLREAGSIRSYGLATWDCFRVPPTDPGHVSLEVRYVYDIVRQHMTVVVRYTEAT
ncbi:hypothetical protein Vretifemale_9662 [Volvox reticuliferus]|uniref:NADP-dependent oxidoreductase domain-containing protein n=1 Tax=Volvox reticuliferus TaxID=1737510 RepID=A0A8J4FPC6_9CHLO|nr:hypothetical protein Vretifemale_9662 [Volvox reticuliferus]